MLVIQSTYTIQTGGGRVWSLVVVPFHLVSSMLAHSPNAHSVLFTGGQYMFTIIKQVALKEKLDWLVGLTTMKAVWRSV